MASSEPVVSLDFDEIFQDANATQAIDAGLRQKAQEVINKARRLDERENNGASNFRLESGFLSNGRRYHRVISDDVAGEFGNADSKRRSILRRASGGPTRG